MVECSFTELVVLGSSPVAVTLQEQSIFLKTLILDLYLMGDLLCLTEKDILFHTKHVPN